MTDGTFLSPALIDYLGGLFSHPHRLAVAVQGAASAQDLELGLDRLVPLREAVDVHERLCHDPLNPPDPGDFERAMMKG